MALLFEGASLALAVRQLRKRELIGESSDPERLRAITELTCADSAVCRIGKPLTMQLGPDELRLNLNVDFRTGLSGDQVKSAVARIESSLRRAHPEIKVIYLEASALRPPSPVG